MKRKRGRESVRDDREPAFTSLCLSVSVVKRSRFAVCISNRDYPASLEPRKIYRVLPDAQAAGRGLMRVIDESGSDYLYPGDYFLPISLPQAVQRALNTVS